MVSAIGRRRVVSGLDSWRGVGVGGGGRLGLVGTVDCLEGADDIGRVDGVLEGPGVMEMRV